MAGNWMDDRERQIRERDGRGLGDSYRSDSYRNDWRSRYDEDRSFDRDQRPGPYAAHRSGPDRDRVFGERESGASYGRADGAPYRSGSAAGGWQDPGYQGVSPAMKRGDYGPSARFDSNDYTGGGRFYGDDDRERIYPEEYGEGRPDYGDARLGYEAQRSPSRERYHAEGYGRPGFGEPQEFGFGAHLPRGDRKPLSGGTGGYDYSERGYGDAGRRESRGGGRLEDASRNAGDFLHRAGEKVASWFNAGGEGRLYDRDSFEPGYVSHRGRGPQGYKRSDERISEDAHERLTDDHFLDASNIVIAVSGGEVTLSGTVDTRHDKHRAEQLIERISGVTHVQNNLRLSGGGATDRDDSVLGSQLRATDDAVSNGTGGSGGGQSTAGRKN